MPREHIHWSVVKSVLQHPKISSRSALFSTLNREVLCAYLGSLAHDIPYYYRAGLDQFEHVAESMHGKDGEDTFDPIRALTKRIVRSSPMEQATLWPFLFGMVSHMATDMVFHPVVYYFTGNYNDPDPAERLRAQARHRLFEVYLEAWIRPQVRFEWGHYLKDLAAANRAQNNRLICALLDEVLTPEKLWPEKSFDAGARSSRWESGLKQLCLYQRLFLSPTVGLVVRAGRTFARGKLDGIDALCAFGRYSWGSFFNQTLRYLNPVTGEEHEENAETLLTRAIDRTADFIVLFEPFLAGETDVDAVLGRIHGASLNYGVAGARADQGKFFSEEGVPLPFLGR